MDRWVARSGAGRCNAAPFSPCRGPDRSRRRRRAPRLRRAASEYQANLQARGIPPPGHRPQAREKCMGRDDLASIGPDGHRPILGRIRSLAQLCRSRCRLPYREEYSYRTIGAVFSRGLDNCARWRRRSDAETFYVSQKSTRGEQAKDGYILTPGSRETPLVSAENSLPHRSAERQCPRAVGPSVGRRC